MTPAMKQMLLQLARGPVSPYGQDWTTLRALERRGLARQEPHPRYADGGPYVITDAGREETKRWP